MEGQGAQVRTRRVLEVEYLSIEIANGVFSLKVDIVVIWRFGINTKSIPRRGVQVHRLQLWVKDFATELT